MKKVLSVILAAVMMFTVMLPAFADEAESYIATFTGPSNDLVTTNPEGEYIGVPYYFVKTENGKISYVEDPDGIYYLGSDGNYYTKDRFIDGTFDPNSTPYSPEVFSPDSAYVLEAGSTLSFSVGTNEAYNAATANVYINGVLATKNSIGEYSVYVDRDFTISVKESVLQKSTFNVVLTSGDGYRVRTLKNENYKTFRRQPQR